MGSAFSGSKWQQQSQVRRELVKEAEEFRRRLIHEVKLRRLQQELDLERELRERESARGSLASVGSDDAEHEEGGDPVERRPLRSFSHLDVGAGACGLRLAEADAASLVVAVPGKVGCEDDQVVVAPGDQHMLLRTRRIHKHRGSAKRSLARRHLTNLEQEREEEDVDIERPGPFATESSCGATTKLLEEERVLIVRVLHRHFLFANLASTELSVLVDRMIRLEMAKGHVVCSKGEKGDACYVILSGVCAVQRDGEHLAHLTAGQTFGELAMLYDVPRAATIECASPRVLLTMIRGPSFRRCLARFKERTKNETLGFLNSHSIFSKLMLEEKRVFAEALSPHALEAGALLIDETVSISADWMFLLQEGTVEITDHYRNRTVVGEGATISGQRLPYGHKAVKAKALSPVKALSISGALISRLFGNISELLRRSTVRAFLESVAVFRELTDRQQTAVAAHFEDGHFGRGELIVSAQADPQLVIVMEGEVAIVEAAGPGAFWGASGTAPLTCAGDCGAVARAPSVAGQAAPAVVPPARPLRRGDVFGEDTFCEGGAMAHSLVAMTDAVVCRAGHDEVCQALRGCADKTPPLWRVVQRNQLKERLQAVFPFSALYEEMLDVVVEAFEIEEHNPNAVILQRGSRSEKFCLVAEGEALLRAVDSAVEPLGRWASFGARELLLDLPTEVEVSAAAMGCTVQCVRRARFVEACGVLFAELSQKMKYQDLRVTASDVVPCEVLGEGQFGLVRRALLRGVFGADFALKRISKRRALELEQQQPVQLEREVLSECCHPLIVRLIATFQDNHSVYFLMENLTGGDLFTAIRDIGRLSEEQTLFFTACVVLAIEYLHARGIMYRDLKPENVMLKETGYLKLVDMGCCSRKARSYTFVGTPEYLAPEVVLGAGYSKAMDWWSVGVIAYEMICGPLPFGEGCGDPLKIFQEVLEKPLFIPRGVAPEAEHLLSSLLERLPEQRLGSSARRWREEIRGHQFFEHLQWDAILQQSALPPYMPPPRGKPPSLSTDLSVGTTSAPVDLFARAKSFEGMENDRTPLSLVEWSNIRHSTSAGEAELSGAVALASKPEDLVEPPDPGADLSCFVGF